MSARHLMVASVIAMSALGAASCARNADKVEPITTSEDRVMVGDGVQLPGEGKPYQVPLEDSLASIRQVPPTAPKFGQAVYVTRLPAPVQRHEPEYPPLARKAGVSGKVIVHTLVLTDGTVGETWIIKSVPMLDRAAAQAVQRWQFTPALDRDKPVAVWVAVPVEFTAGAH